MAYNDANVYRFLSLVALKDAWDACSSRNKQQSGWLVHNIAAALRYIGIQFDKSDKLAMKAINYKPNHKRAVNTIDNRSQPWTYRQSIQFFLNL